MAVARARVGIVAGLAVLGVVAALVAGSSRHSSDGLVG